MEICKRQVVQWVQEQIQDSIVLLSAQPEVMAEELRRMEGAALVYRFLPLRDFGADDAIVAGAMVGLELAGKQSYCLLVPSCGGYVTSFDGVPVQVLSLRSPLGQSLEGKRIGQTASVEIGGKLRSYRVVSIA